MKFLIISDVTVPEKRLVCQMIDDISISLIKLGHKVTNLTYRSEKKVDRKYKIIRLGLKDIKKKNSIFKRIIFEVLNATCAYFYFLINNKKMNYNIIYIYSPSIFLAFSSILFWKNFKNKKILFLQDITIQNALSIRITRENGFIFKIIKKIEGFIFKNVDIIFTHTKSNIFFFNKNYQEFSNKINLVHNFSDLKIQNSYKNYFEYKNYVDVVFLGNIGEFQYFPKMLDLIKELSQFNFYFYGDGSKKSHFSRYIKLNSIKNCFLKEPIDQSEISKILSGNVIGLVILSDEYNSGAIPGKITTYFSYGVPLISYTPKNHELFNLIENYNLGININKSHIIKNTSLIKKILCNKKNLKELSMNAIKFFKENYETNTNINRILKKSKIEKKNFN